VPSGGRPIAFAEAVAGGPVTVTTGKLSVDSAPRKQQEHHRNSSRRRRQESEPLRTRPTNIAGSAKDPPRRRLQASVLQRSRMRRSHFAELREILRRIPQFRATALQFEQWRVRRALLAVLPSGHMKWINDELDGIRTSDELHNARCGMRTPPAGRPTSD
jgi:hypothetical protein